MTTAQAITLALQDAGISFASHVPGFGGTELFAELNATRTSQGLSVFHTSFHEEVAYGTAYGASLTGARSACIIKSHGLSKAMNAVMDSLSGGVTAGLVTLIFEDHGGSHSDNIINIEPVVAGCRIPYGMSAASTAYSDVLSAFQRSEELQLPFALIFDADDIDKESPVGNRTPLAAPPTYHRNVQQHLVCPLFAAHQHNVLNGKLSGSDWRAISSPGVPTVPDDLPPAYQRAVTPYLTLFKIAKEIGTGFVSGDAGVSTLSALEPYSIVNAAGYMGGSLPMSMGALIAGIQNVWAFTGDFSFIAAGHLALPELVMRELSLKIVVFANGKAQTTGGQSLDLKLLDRILRGYEAETLHLRDPHDESETRRVLTEAQRRTTFTIIVAHYA